MWRMSAPAWHGIARADVFLTAGGPRVCELNSDTPSGEPEAVTLNRVVDGAGAAAFDDPNCRLARRVFEMLEAAAPRGRPLTVGIVYPTEITEDLSVIELYARWFEARGARVVLGSPFNLRPDGRAAWRCSASRARSIWRHYKTDWWGERRTVWRSEDGYADAAPLTSRSALLAGAVARGRCAVVNPFGAVLTQNKRMMALLWEELDRGFPRWARAAVRRYLPSTARLEALPPARLRASAPHWVLKSDYGCEGEEVVIGAETTRRRVGARARRRHPAPLDRAAPVRAAAATPRASRQLRRLRRGRPRPRGCSRGCRSGATDRTRASCAPTMVRLP